MYYFFRDSLYKRVYQRRAFNLELCRWLPKILYTCKKYGKVGISNQIYISIHFIQFQEPKDPLENLCKILERLAKLDEENKQLKTRIDFLERQDALQKIIINSTFGQKYKTEKEDWDHEDSRLE